MREAPRSVSLEAPRSVSLYSTAVDMSEVTDIIQINMYIPSNNSTQMHLRQQSSHKYIPNLKIDNLHGFCVFCISNRRNKSKPGGLCVRL
mmetsp:Transcript_97591/g.157390  ORF Transcript_97591/g.157390 Transcript_97591/m.157390 type:complete len:90 (+) Transcript_97591:1880-2149(+)